MRYINLRFTCLHTYFNLLTVVLKAQLKDSLHDAEVIAIARDEAVSAAKEADKKYKTSEAELLQLQADLASSERARKAAQAERDDLQEELNSGSSTRLTMLLLSYICHFYAHGRRLTFTVEY